MSMVLVYGVGNDERMYLSTKHNIGRLVVEDVIRRLGLMSRLQRRVYTAQSDSVALMVPTGYMNVSGEPLADYIRYFKYSPGDITLLIIQDDSDQIEGNWKCVRAGGSAGHKGIDSIYRLLPRLGINSDQVWRLKAGIRPTGNTARSETFVLSGLSATDHSVVSSLGASLTQHFNVLSDGDMTTLQMRLNSHSL